MKFRRMLGRKICPAQRSPFLMCRFMASTKTSSSSKASKLNSCILDRIWMHSLTRVLTDLSIPVLYSHKINGGCAFAFAQLATRASASGELAPHTHIPHSSGRCAFAPMSHARIRPRRGLLALTASRIPDIPHLRRSRYYKYRMASLPCRLCGVDTHVSVGYAGTFVKCMQCRHLSGNKRPAPMSPGLDTEEGMRAFVDSILDEGPGPTAGSNAQAQGGGKRLCSVQRPTS